jgi:serine/threonine protein kinase
LKANSSDAFEREETALRRIHNIDDVHLIKVKASIKRGQVYYFLFPWADGGSLRTFWKDKNQVPRTAKLIRWIFEQFKGLAGAVAKLHNSSNTFEENGRHGDLKPENILFFPEKAGQGTLVITDVGLTRFHVQVTDQRVNITNTTDASIDYGPPEALNHDVRSRKYDIWSLACVFLEFTVWIFGGVDEQERFKKARSGSSKDCPYYLNKKTPKLHPKVNTYINRLRSERRCGTCTGFRELLRIIENDLLKIEPNDRLGAVDLENKLDNILQQAARQTSYLFSDLNQEGSFSPSPLPKGKSLM